MGQETGIRFASFPFPALESDVVYVIYCFQKKTEKTRKADLDLASKRYRDVLQELGQ